LAERIEFIIITLTKFSIQLSHRISMSLYLFSLLMVTTHSLYLTSLLSNHHHRSKSLTAPSNMLRLIFGSSFLHHSVFLIQIIHPSLSDLEHAGLTCHTLLSPSITFSLFDSKLTCSENLILTLVCFCLSDWSHGSRPFTGLICSSFFYVL